MASLTTSQPAFQPGNLSNRADPKHSRTPRDRISTVYQLAAAWRAAPRPPQPLPVQSWARSYGLIPAPGTGAHAVSLIGPGPALDPEFAMATDLDEPVIIATITGSAGELAGPLLIDGCHRLYKAAQLGREHLPSFVLTAAETLAIRSDAVLGPARDPGRAGGKERRP